MSLARMIAFAAIGAVFMVVIHRLNTGGYDHLGVTIVTGILLGLFAGFMDKLRRRNAVR